MPWALLIFVWFVTKPGTVHSWGEGDDTVIVVPGLVVDEAQMFETVRVTTYDPAVVYWCAPGFWAPEVGDPSPKFQVHAVPGPPVEASENVTVSGMKPDVGTALIAATGAVQAGPP